MTLFILFKRGATELSRRREIEREAETQRATLTSAHFTLQLRTRMFRPTLRNESTAKAHLRARSVRRQTNLPRTNPQITPIVAPKPTRNHLVSNCSSVGDPGISSGIPRKLPGHTGGLL
jgi:hypothetical protein